MNGSGKFKMAVLNRKWMRQNAFISVSTLDSNAIQTAINMFSGSSIPMGHVSMPYDAKLGGNGSGKFKMSAYTHEMHRSQLPD